ncbi:hypothetical protein I4U23_013162 [Adineta vaga]|nr:hypothetical protein I4U23_013162 [Adineta vaga]
MASNNDLDDFFKKKDRKSNKSKKQTTSSMLSNNEELLKQLVIVTSATIAFKENMISDDDDDDNQLPINDESIVKTQDTHKQQKTKVPDRNKPSNEQYINISSKIEGQQQEQDQWEYFEESNSNYEAFRSKLKGGKDDKEDNDDYYDDENNPNNNDNNNDVPGDREQQKDRPVWKINSVKEEQQQQHSEPVVEQKIEEPKPVPTPTSVYRPPQLRSGSSVTVVGGGNVNPRVTKKKEPNLASIDDFPTLGATVNKK